MARKTPFQKQQEQALQNVYNSNLRSTIERIQRQQRNDMAVINNMGPQGLNGPAPKYEKGIKLSLRNSETWEVRDSRRSALTTGSPYEYLIRCEENGREETVSERDLERIVGEATMVYTPGPVEYATRISRYDLGSIYETGGRVTLKQKPAAKPKKPKPVVDFNSVVIADEKRQQILEAMEQINQQKLIFEDWGFGETIEKGKGVSMLFYGPPGTGKTLMAQAIAEKLDRKLMVISTAQIESSAPGEAERNIIKHFEEATKNKQVLLFDECDSLIFTRKNAGPILGAQINQLLSSIEKFEGLTLFTTNRLGTLDEAVNRRLALKLEFDMPNQEQRAEIWKRMFPKKAPLEKDVDFERLAIVEVTGGYIKNAVLRAARMAATQKGVNSRKKIKMEHLILALKYETESMIEFEGAREQYESGIGKVVGPGIGIQSGQIQKQQAIRKIENM